MSRIGIVLRVPRRDGALRAELTRAQETLRLRAARVRELAEHPGVDLRHAASLRGKAVAYKESADLVDAVLRRVGP